MSRVFRWIVSFLFKAKKWMTNFCCRNFYVIVPRGSVWSYVIASYLGSKRIFKILNSKWSYDKMLIDWVGLVGSVRPSNSVNKYIYICYLPGRRSVWEKTVLEVLSTDLSMNKLSQLQDTQLNLLTVTFLTILKWRAINQRWLFIDGTVKEAKDWRLPLTFKSEI